jgi:ElaB/YqjD/DUF883 family membrane-anchored ribosome-binding protein
MRRRSAMPMGEGDETANRNDDFKQLFDSVEDLIKRVADIDSSEIQKIRAKARIALMAARSAVEDGAAQLRDQAMQVAATTDDYVHVYPWQTVGVAALLGVAMGLLVKPQKTH